MEEYLDHTGVVRLLGRTQPDVKALQRRMRCAQLSSLGPLIPRDQWRSFGRRKAWGNLRFILNQGRYGACVGYSAATALMRRRHIAGLAYQRLSGAYIYDQINGGQDHGACITDAMGVLVSKGTCTEDEYLHPFMNRDLQPSSLGRFIESGDYTITSFDEIGTAITRGAIVQFPIRVGQNFGDFTGDGVAGFTPGPGNHSVCGDDMVLVNGIWYVQVPNTWGLEWGPFEDGYVLVSERHIQSAGAESDAFAHVGALSDPKDPGDDA